MPKGDNMRKAKPGAPGVEPRTGDPIPIAPRDKPRLKPGRKSNAQIASSMPGVKGDAAEPRPAQDGPEAAPEAPGFRPGASGTGSAKAGPTTRKGARTGQDLERLATQIQGTAAVIAAMLNFPPFQLAPAEAKAQAEAVIAVQDEFGLDVFSGKPAAILGLLGVSAVLWTPRLMAYRNHMAEQAYQAERQGGQHRPGLRQPQDGRHRPGPAAAPQATTLDDVETMGDLPIDTGPMPAEGPGPGQGVPQGPAGGAPFVNGNHHSPNIDPPLGGGRAVPTLGDVPVVG